ncbi:MAG TPA: SPFH domain-containing protein [Steroidobacteraceae bacterium]|nr:SPFH domain-containing protein [Steroidobacteraceae bacterium]
MDRRNEERAADLLPRPQRLVRRLCWLYGSVTVAVILLLLSAALPSTLLPQTRLLAREVFSGGLGAIVLASLLLALTALAASLAMTAARARHAAAHAAAAAARITSATTASTSSTPSRLVPVGRTRWSFDDPGFVARQGQALIVTLGAVLVWLAMRLLWPRSAVAPDATAANIAAAFVFAIAFVSLMAERVMNEFPAPQLPEAPLLRRLLLLVTVLLAAAACAEIGRSAALGWVRWPELVLLWVPALVALELALRALARLFLPPPQPANARSIADSVIVGLLTGGPRAPGNLLRTHFGLDFARSWALSFLSAAILPALFGTALLCWGLSGLKLIDLTHRGVYERFGAPVAVYGPGLHLLLPWPFGRLRTVEYGAIHSVAIGVDAGATPGAPPAVSSAALAEVSDAQVNAELQKVAEQDQVSLSELPEVFAAEGIDYTQYRQQLRRQMAASLPGAQPGQPESTPLISAEATPPLSLNRLWESAHADQAHYLVASQGTGQGFQSVATEIYVLYRVGLSKQDALQSIYTVSDPEALIREDASRLVLRYFNSRTLDEVLYAQREDVAGQLRDELSRDIAAYHTGADIVSVLIEEIHPPAGAAEAYHAVQAAEINSRAAISDELGRAKRTAGVAQQEAHELLAAANAKATETRDTANAAAYRFSIDRRAYAQDGRSFVLERLYGSLTTALRGKALTIMDHRLSSSDGPMIDMRPIAQGSAPAGLTSAPATPSTQPAGPPIELEPAFTNAD